MPSKTLTHVTEKSSASVYKPPPAARALRHLPERINPAAAFQRAMTAPAEMISSADIFALQRTAGNRAVEQMLAERARHEQQGRLTVQAKLTVGAADDQYEREADRVADEVVQRSEPSVPNIQRQTSHEDLEEEMIQRKPLASSITRFVQRQQQPEDEEEQSPLVMRRKAPGSAMAAPDVETAIEQSHGGERLAGDVRARMERAFGVDFGGVKVHTDFRADSLNRSLGALAFTTGRDIFFRHGAYNPNAPSGRHLLAHELTHVVQQNAAGNAGSFKSESPKFAKASNNYHVQRQQFGQAGQAFIGDPAAQEARPNNNRQNGDNVEYNSVATDNEKYGARQTAFDRAKRIALQEGNPVRTYHFFANQQAGANNIGTSIVLTGAAGLNPAARYGYYYDFGDGGLVVEHTQDNQATYYTINNNGNRTATINPALHFHAARYNGAKYVAGQPNNGFQAAAPPQYDLVRGGHHVYH